MPYDTEDENYLANWGRDEDEDYSWGGGLTDPFAGISGYNPDGFGGTDKPLIYSELPGSAAFISGINPDAFESQYGTSQGAPYTYDNTGVVAGVGGSSANSAASNVAKILGLTPNQLAQLALSGITLADLLKSRKDRKAAQVKTYAWNTPMLTATRSRIAQAPRATGQGAVGQSYFTAPTYTARAAEGGIMGLAKGGLRDGSFIIPADVVSHFGNGSSEAGLEVLSKRLGAVPIKGKGDGMSDSIDTTIEGQRPAKVAHEEAIVSPEKVAALGKGDPKKGAKVLYAMMDRVRKARTGTKKQGKQINPAKFVPGGAVGYAGGGIAGIARFDAGGTATTTTPPAAAPAAPAVNTNLAAWSGPYVQDYLSKGFALADAPYQAYTGALSAGASDLQKDAFQKYLNLGPYTGTNFSSQYTPPAAYTAGTFDSGFSYTPTEFNAAYYQAPDDYQATNFTTGLGQVGSVQDYMNPYMQSVVDINAREARRQADIDRLGIASRLTAAGAYGGSRQAIMEAEQRRNLQQQIGDIQAKGSKEAYENALARQLAVSDRYMKEQAEEEASRQFGYGQRMNKSELMARYGLDADKAQALENQFKAKQAADYKLEQQRLAETSRQFGYGQQMTAADRAASYGLDAQRASEASKQFGARYGLDALTSQLSAGSIQRGIDADAIAAQKAQFDEQRKYDLEMQKYKQSLLGGLPIGSEPAAPLPTFSSEAMQALVATGKQYPQLKAWLESMGITIPG